MMPIDGAWRVLKTPPEELATDMQSLAADMQHLTTAREALASMTDPPQQIIDLVTTLEYYIKSNAAYAQGQFGERHGISDHEMSHNE